MTKIKIILNGEERLLDEGTTIAKLVADLDLNMKKIAVEKDLEIVNLQQFKQCILYEGSCVEIVHFIGGG